MLKRLIYAAVGVVGLALIGLAIASATAWRADDVLRASATADGAIVVTDPGVLEMAGDPVTVRATVPDGARVVLAVGRDTDVDGWVGTDPYQRVSGLASWTSLTLAAGAAPSPDEGAAPDGTAPADATAASGEAAPAVVPDAAASDMWVAQAAGEGSAELTWQAQPGRWSLLVVGSAADGTATPPTLELAWPRTVTTPYLVPGTVVGALLALLALLLFGRDVRRAHRGPAEWTPVLTEPVPVVTATGAQQVLTRRQLRELRALAEAGHRVEIPAATGELATVGEPAPTAVDPGASTAAPAPTTAEVPVVAAVPAPGGVVAEAGAVPAVTADAGEAAPARPVGRRFLRRPVPSSAPEAETEARAAAAISAAASAEPASSAPAPAAPDVPEEGPTPAAAAVTGGPAADAPAAVATDVPADGVREVDVPVTGEWPAVLDDGGDAGPTLVPAHGRPAWAPVRSTAAQRTAAPPERSTWAARPPVSVDSSASAAPAAPAAPAASAPSPAPDAPAAVPARTRVGVGAGVEEHGGAAHQPAWLRSAAAVDAVHDRATPAWAPAPSAAPPPAAPPGAPAGEAAPESSGRSPESTSAAYRVTPPSRSSEQGSPERPVASEPAVGAGAPGVPPAPSRWSFRRSSLPASPGASPAPDGLPVPQVAAGTSHVPAGPRGAAPDASSASADVRPAPTGSRGVAPEGSSSSAADTPPAPADPRDDTPAAPSSPDVAAAPEPAAAPPAEPRPEASRADAWRRAWGLPPLDLEEGEK